MQIEAVEVLESVCKCERTRARVCASAHVCSNVRVRALRIKRCACVKPTVVIERESIHAWLYTQNSLHTTQADAETQMLAIYRLSHRFRDPHRNASQSDVSDALLHITIVSND